MLERVPLWFHTFALNAEHDLYTPGVARDHRYRVPFLPASFAGQRVLDVGTFDGFYAFLAEHRGAERVVAVDSEQYVDWVRARWGVELEPRRRLPRDRGAAGLASRVRARRRARAGATRRSASTWSSASGSCTASRTRSACCASSAACSRRAGACCSRPTGSPATMASAPSAPIEVQQPSDVYSGDDFVYWAFGAGGLGALATLAGFPTLTIHDAPTIDGHPRIIGTLERPAR